MLLRSRRVLSRAGKEAQTAWQLPPGAEAVSEGFNRCMLVEGDGSEYRLIRQPLPIQAFTTGSKWRLTARLKGAGVEKADMEWKTACLRWGMQSGGRIEYPAVSLPVGDSDWREVSVDMTVPAGLSGITVEAGMNGNKGSVWIDDARVERVK